MVIQVDDIVVRPDVKGKVGTLVQVSWQGATLPLHPAFTIV
jgi:hypothetical protein